MANLTSQYLPNVSYRQWLQDRAANGSSDEVRKQSNALLQVVGDDGRIDARFIDNPFKAQTGGTGYNQGAGQYYGYGPQGMNAINDQMMAAFQSKNVKYSNDRNAQGGSPSTGSAGNYYTGGQSSAKEAEQKRFYEKLLATLPGRKQESQRVIDEKYDSSLNSLARQKASGLGNLDREQSKLDKQRSKSYGQIQNDTQNLLQGANTTLGMYGAGNSSAAQMAAFGAADAANKQSGDITDQYNEQTGDVMVARKDLEDEYNEKKKQTDDWKKDQLRDMNEKYTNIENDYRGRIGGEANLQAIVNTFQNLKNPDAKLKNLSDYKVDGLNQVDMSGAVKAPTLDTGQAQKFFTSQTTANRKKKDDETDPNNPYGF